MYSRENLQELLTKAFYKNNSLGGKKVILRSCLNVAIDERGKIIDDTRLWESLPTIKDLVQITDRLVILGHLGRPDLQQKVIRKDMAVSGQALAYGLNTDVTHDHFSLQKVADWFNFQLMNTKKYGQKIEVILIKHPSEINDYETGGQFYKVFMLENVRYNLAEESTDENERIEFAKELAMLGEVFVNDAFPDYRISASTYDLAKLLPSYLGEAFYNEVIALSRFTNPPHPFVAVLGGAKLSEKLDAMLALLEIADKVAVGGAMAYTLLKAKGINVGRSVVEDDKLSVAQKILSQFSHKILLPIDHVVCHDFHEHAITSVTPNEQIEDGTIAIDIGPNTVELYEDAIKVARTILLNGPMGVFEWEDSSQGTERILEAIVGNNEAYTLAGGGDSIAAINEFKVKGFSHISTGGGAMLSFLAYDTFPTLDVIWDAGKK